MSRKIIVLAAVLFVATIASPAPPASAVEAFKYVWGTVAHTSISADEYSFLTLDRVTAPDEPTDEFSFAWHHVYVEDGIQYWQGFRRTRVPYNGFETTSRYHQRRLHEAHFRFSTTQVPICTDDVTDDTLPVCEYGTLTMKVRWDGFGRKHVETDGRIHTATRRSYAVASLGLDGVPLPLSDHLVGGGNLVMRKEAR
jgi:hypothetical protein